jgi:ribosomal protein S18 acetylase RimI-like enzyme
MVYYSIPSAAGGGVIGIWRGSLSGLPKEQRVTMTEDETTQHSSQWEIVLRDATPNDIEAIAPLHADSWRQHYRGALSDAFLDGDVIADRRAVWSERLMSPGANQFTIVADNNDAVVGFVHMILDRNPDWGALLDNLHVTYQLKRHGIGHRLLSAAAHELARRRPNDQRFYLWVLDQNTAAQAFYITCGGRDVETTLGGPFPDGHKATSHRMVWPDAATVK